MQEDGLLEALSLNKSDGAGNTKKSGKTRFRRGLPIATKKVRESTAAAFLNGNKFL